MSRQILDDPFQEDHNPLAGLQFAGFWPRLGASLIDTFLFIPLLAVSLYNVLSPKIYFLALLCEILMMAYKPLMEWRYGATVGKMAMNLKVINSQAQPISWDQSMIRFIFYFAAYMVSIINNFMVFRSPGFEGVRSIAELGVFQQQHQNNVLTELSVYALFFSVIMVVFDHRCQAMHDKFAKTFCVHAP